jgi:hypothetical protein
MMDTKPVEQHTTLLVPIVIRLALLVVVPVIEFVFHKLAHAGIHLSIEKVDWMKRLAKRFKYLPDMLMIAALLILHYVSE